MSYSEHEKPSDAAVVTSRDLRHSIFLRSADTDAAATAALQRLAALVHDLAKQCNCVRSVSSSHSSRGSGR